MKTAGIIAEYNPFHNGHAYQLRQVKNCFGADFAVVVLSGDFVQRGAPALIEKHVRTEMALRCGADLVLELPVCACTSSAETFAMGGVSLLDGIGVIDFLCFGAENDDPELFSRAADLLLEPESIARSLRQFLKEGLSFPAARSLALEPLLANIPAHGSSFPDTPLASIPSHESGSSGTPLANIPAHGSAHENGSSDTPLAIIPAHGSGFPDTPLASLPSHENLPTEIRHRSGDPAYSSEKARAFLSQPNNILGVEYVKALKRLNSSISPLPLKRKGAGYHAEQTGPGQFPSATAIRRLLLSLPAHTIAQASPLSRMVPPEALPLLLSALEENRILSEADLDSLLRYRLLLETPETLKKYQDISPDLARKIYKMRYRCEGFSSFAGLLHSKELTRTRIQRGLLHILLELPPRPAELPYARILGFRTSARPLLGEIKRKSRIPVIAKAADASAILDAASLDLFRESVQASHIYESILSQKTKKAFRHEFEKPLIIL